MMMMMNSWLCACLQENTRLIFAQNKFEKKCKTIAVGGGGAGGAVAPPFGLKRRKSSKIRANSLNIWAHHRQNTVSVSVQTFFLKSTSIWTENPFKFQGRPFFFFFFGEHLNRRVDFLKSLGGSNSVTRTFFSGILRTLLALFVHCRFCLKCLYVAIAHLMQFFFFFGVMPFRKLSVQYFGKGKKNSLRPKVD